MKQLNALSLDPNDSVYLVKHPVTGVDLIYNGSDNPVVPNSISLELWECKETKGRITLVFLKKRRA